MARSNLLLAGLLLAFLQAASAEAIENGNYRGSAKYGGDLTLSVRRGIAQIEVKADGCVGDTEGRLTSAGKGRWQMRPDWPGCVIQLRQKGSTITVEENSDCFQLHGAQCSFDGNLSAKSTANAKK